jgi:transcriptional regulator with XRE-family HTH domain
MAEKEFTATGKAAHHGRNVKRFREMWGWKQDALAARLGPEWTQKKVSQLEATEAIDGDLLAAISKALNVTTDVLRNFSEEAASVFFSDFRDTSTANGIVNQYNCTFNALDKYVEAVGKIESLYEALLKSEREKITILERFLEKKA